MTVDLAVLRSRDPDGTETLSLHFNDCMDRIDQMIAGIGSFDELCRVISATMAEWHKPRYKPPAHVKVRIRDESDYPNECRKLTLPPEAIPLHFEPHEKRLLSLAALTATVDAYA